MSANAVRCPNCGGDVDLDAKVCPYCDSDIICSEYDRQKRTIADFLIAARNDISADRFRECRSHIDDVLSMDPDCSDAWYMSAAMLCGDDERFEEERRRASSCSSDYGIFGESDLRVYKKKARLEEKKKIRTTFLITEFFVLFFGGTLSLGLGLGLGTLIPLYVTSGLVLILLIAYLLVTLRYRHND